MPSVATCFHAFHHPVAHIALPERFTYPFFYQPHAIATVAANALIDTLESQPGLFTHDFNSTKDGSGKMFGVLVVKNPQGQLGYLTAFSGKIDDKNHHHGFVPPVFDMLEESGFFRTSMKQINHVSEALQEAENALAVSQLKPQLSLITLQAEQEIEQLRLANIERKAQRKHKRQALLDSNSDASQIESLSLQWSRESVADKNKLKHLKSHWQLQISSVQELIDLEQHKIEQLKQQRAQRSNQLQRHLFKQYRFFNARNEEKDLIDIFSPTKNPTPPAGSGECAAPKLLQYAYLHQMQPIALAEFWWGASPKSEIRKHKQYYPACQSKCEPILGHMLQGLDVDDNPLLINPAQGKPLEILYQDEAIVVVNKPANFLSVPGRYIADSAFTRLQAQFSDSEGPFVIHRLDMATSGILVFALTRRANKSLQKQFISRSVKKRYIAKISAQLTEQHGEIHLPMRGDPYDRPRQLVCHSNGKPALTLWQVKEQDASGTTLYLSPHTGRTHQLRVHCAHHEGFDSAIIGDTLYGEPNKRLYLHAESLTFIHPYSQEQMHFQVDADF
ncbi:pseudouridine synthase [Vibrio sp. FNV 38]|nr:pseudouridine synthase [Vibrio sp. FNV 38]